MNTYFTYSKLTTGKMLAKSTSNIIFEYSFRCTLVTVFYLYSFSIHRQPTIDNVSAFFLCHDVVLFCLSSTWTFTSIGCYKLNFQQH